MEEIRALVFSLNIVVTLVRALVCIKPQEFLVTPGHMLHMSKSFLSFLVPRHAERTGQRMPPFQWGIEVSWCLLIAVQHKYAEVIEKSRYPCY